MWLGCRENAGKQKVENTKWIFICSGGEWHERYTWKWWYVILSSLIILSLFADIANEWRRLILFWLLAFLFVLEVVSSQINLGFDVLLELSQTSKACFQVAAKVIERSYIFRYEKAICSNSSYYYFSDIFHQDIRVTGSFLLSIDHRMLFLRIPHFPQPSLPLRSNSYLMSNYKRN